MATVTRAVQQSRPHDYIYDPLFTVAGPVDHFRAQPPPGIERLPNKQNFFSEGRNYPRFEYRLKLDDKVPAFVSRAWKGPEAQGHASYRDVSGGNLLRYFKRPLVPLMQSVGPELVYSKPTVSEAVAKDVEHRKYEAKVDEALPQELSAQRTVAVQSDYRESEAQTDPYTPEFSVPEGTDPEILAIQELKFGHGLPAGLKEVEYIDRVRRRRAIEASLPALTDAKSMKERQQILEELEWTEWREREDEIEALQAERLNLFRTAVEEFDAELEEKTEKRIEDLKARLSREREEKFEEIQKRRVKTLRKLAKARKDTDKGKEKREIIEDYSNFGSTKYVPITREGFVPEKGTKLNEQDFIDSLNPNEVLEFDRTLPASTLKATVQRPSKATLKTTSTRKAQQLSKHLDRMEQKIKEKKETQREAEENKDDILAAYRTVVRVRRPPTPTVEKEILNDEEEEERKKAIIFVQRLFRGRAIQNMMFEGKEKRLELIQELRSVEGLEKAEEEMKSSESVELGKKKDFEKAHEENVFAGAMRRMEGAVVSQTLDLLAKELLRYREERRLDAMVRLAERERQRREAEEAGRRQHVADDRQKEDERFRGLLGVHQETAQSFLRTVMRSAASEAAQRKATREAEIKNTTLGSIMNTLEDRYNSTEAVVKDLFYAFLLPEVRRQELRAQGKKIAVFIWFAWACNNKCCSCR